MKNYQEFSKQMWKAGMRGALGMAFFTAGSVLSFVGFPGRWWYQAGALIILAGAGIGLLLASIYQAKDAMTWCRKYTSIFLSIHNRYDAGRNHDLFLYEQSGGDLVSLFKSIGSQYKDSYEVYLKERYQEIQQRYAQIKNNGDREDCNTKMRELMSLPTWENMQAPPRGSSAPDEFANLRAGVASQSPPVLQDEVSLGGTIIKSEERAGLA